MLFAQNYGVTTELLQSNILHFDFTENIQERYKF